MSRAQWLLVWQLFAISKALRLPSTPSRINRANIRCSAADDDRHEKWMRYAAVAERGRLSTAPNPWVGCVIVAGDGEEILAEGFHKQKGGPHAEATALANAKERGITREQMEAATCYVTLEPCHRGPGKTTPPCDEALVASGLKSVHIALVDPDPSFGSPDGTSCAAKVFLESQGVSVTVGTGAAAVAESLRPYLHQRSTKKPYVVLKVASAADGSIACQDFTSQWITGEAARADAQMLRASSQAVLVGSGTAIADNPRLTLRLNDEQLPEGWLKPFANPLRVVLDARGRLTGPCALLDSSDARTLIFTTKGSIGTDARKRGSRQVRVLRYARSPLLKVVMVLTWRRSCSSLVSEELYS